MNGVVSGIAQWIAEVVYSSGYVGVGALVAAGYLHLPVPTALVLPLAGFLVEQGRFSFLPVLLATTVGGAAASLILYLPGLWLGEERMRRVIEKYGKFLFVHVSDFDRASGMFDRHGGKAVFIGHLVPGITALISIPAGLKRMPIYGRFLLYTVLGCLLWNGIFIILGWLLGESYTLIERYLPVVEWTVIGAIVVAVAFFVWRRWRSYRRKHPSSDDA